MVRFSSEDTTDIAGKPAGTKAALPAFGGLSAALRKRVRRLTDGAALRFFVALPDEPREAPRIPEVFRVVCGCRSTVRERQRFPTVGVTISEEYRFSECAALAALCCWRGLLRLLFSTKPDHGASPGSTADATKRVSPTKSRARRVVHRGPGEVGSPLLPKKRVGAASPPRPVLVPSLCVYCP
jgi:hypothetical protein